MYGIPCHCMDVTEDNNFLFLLDVIIDVQKMK